MRNHAQICSFNCGFLMDSEHLGIYLLATFAVYLFLIITIMSRRNTRHLGVSWGKRLYEFCIALRYVCCIILEHLFLRIPLDGCFQKTEIDIPLPIPESSFYATTINFIFFKFLISVRYCPILIVKPKASPKFSTNTQYQPKEIACSQSNFYEM